VVEGCERENRRQHGGMFNQWTEHGAVQYASLSIVPTAGMP
jgi:hypothetical protein